MYREVSTHASIPEFRSSGILGIHMWSEAHIRGRQGPGSKVDIRNTCDKKQFYEGTKGQKAQHNIHVIRSSSTRVPRDRRHIHAQHDMRQKQFYEGPRDRRHIRNPESLNSGMLVGKDPTLSTCIRITPPHRYGAGSIPTSIRNSGIQEC